MNKFKSAFLPKLVPIMMSILGAPSALAASPAACNEALDLCHIVGVFGPGVLPGVTVAPGEFTPRLIEFSNGQWSFDGQVFATFGGPGWTPFVGDWDGDGYDEPGLMKETDWWFKTSWQGPWINGWVPAQFGSLIGKPVTGDWDGDGIDGVGYYEKGRFTLANDVSLLTDTFSINFGLNDNVGDSHIPIVGPLNSGVDLVGVQIHESLQYAPTNNPNNYDFLSYNDPNLIIGTLSSLPSQKSVPLVIDLGAFGQGSVNNSIGFLELPGSDPTTCPYDYGCYDVVMSPGDEKPVSNGGVIIPLTNPWP